MKKINALYAIFGYLLALAAPAQAAYIEYSTNFSADNFLSNTSTFGGSLSDAGTIVATTNLNRFDSSLGTLNGVEISFTSNWSHNTYASAYDSASESTRHSYTRSYSCGWFHTCYYTDYYYTYFNDTYVSATSNNTLSMSLTDPSSSTRSTTDLNYTSCNSYIGTAGGAGCSDSDLSSGAFNGSLDLSSFDLSQFVTSDPSLNPLVLQMTNLTSINGSCDNNDPGDSCSARSESAWGGSITVGYTYSKVLSQAAAPIPEPGTLLLMSAGLLGAGVRRKIS